MLRIGELEDESEFPTPTRWSAEQVVGIREIGARVEAELRAGHRWWDERWALWKPPPGWEPWSQAEG
jgi:hypothetical protein